MAGCVETWRVHNTTVSLVNDMDNCEFDAVVLVSTPGHPGPKSLENFVAAARHLDATLDKGVTVLPCCHVSGGRLVFSSTGPLTPYDDVRSIYEASLAGVKRACEAGAIRPVIVLQPHRRWPSCELVALLAAIEALYVPLQVRESFPAQAMTAEELGVYGEGVCMPLAQLVTQAVALEEARGLARDIGGADPERMTPLATAKYLSDAFRGSPVRLNIIDDAATIKRQYPLMAAVMRASNTVERHRSCVIHLEYVPKKYERTVMLVGKGVTYDTGGCDIKAGGNMVGMSRDKCGAAAIAGFLKACVLLKPNIKVVAALGMTRNSVGENAYVADELIKSRLGLAVRIGNTDGEGRLVLGDLLAEMVERAGCEKEPHLYTVATLTGHVIRAYGDAYTAALDNFVAAERDHARALQASGAMLGDMLEVSTLRREDLATHQPRMAGDNVHQCGNKPSSMSERGHQAPVAFLLMVSGADCARVPFTHLDIAGSAGILPKPPTAAPLLALAAHYDLLQPCFCYDLCKAP